MATLKMPASGLDNTQLVKRPGWFHFIVDKADEQPTKKQTGELIDKIHIQATCQGGTDKTQEKGQFGFWLRNPSESHKDGGEFCAKIQGRFADALCILPHAEPGEEVDVPWAKSGGRQFIASLTLQKGTDGVERLDLDGSEVYHVDDPAVAHVPKNQAVLKLLPAALRRLATDKNDARNTAAGGGAAPAGKAAVPAAKTGGNGAAKQPVGAGAGGNGGETFNPDDL